MSKSDVRAAAEAAALEMAPHLTPDRLDDLTRKIELTIRDFLRTGR